MPLYQSCIRVVPELYPSCIRVVSELYQSCIRVVSELYQSCIGVLYVVASHLSGIKKSRGILVYYYTVKYQSLVASHLHGDRDIVQDTITPCHHRHGVSMLHHARPQRVMHVCHEIGFRRLQRMGRRLVRVVSSGTSGMSGGWRIGGWCLGRESF